MGCHISCPPDEAILITGCCLNHQQLIVGGRVFRCPGRKYERLSMRPFSVDLKSKGFKTFDDQQIIISLSAQVRINCQNFDMLSAAFEQFLGKSASEQVNYVAEVLEDVLQKIVATYTFEKIEQDKKAFSKEAAKASSPELAKCGILAFDFSLTIAPK